MPLSPSPSTALHNPYRPGAGHRPPYLAGREEAIADIEGYFDQTEVLTNIVLTGLRGVGKTVLLEELRTPASQRGWYWVATDLSESASVSEDSLATRLLADLAVVTSGFQFQQVAPPGPGFTSRTRNTTQLLDYAFLRSFYDQTPGMVADKLKTVLEASWSALKSTGARGVIFAYDEAQNLADHAAKEQYPLSMLLDLFQSIQRRGTPYMLLLTGLPTLFPKLVEARTFAERMFHVVTLDRLKPQHSREAISKPVESQSVKFTGDGIARIIELSGGYPYFIQFICRESFDLVLRKEKLVDARLLSIVAKLDTDFFAGRWAKATDRQRDLMMLIATLPSASGEFSVQEIVEASVADKKKPFSNSHVNQMLSSLQVAGLIFKNRHGRYTFAVPLFAQFLNRLRSGMS